MARPESFNSAKKRKPKKPKDYGKLTEKLLLEGLRHERMQPSLAARFHDNISVDSHGRMLRRAGSESMPDFVLFTHGASHLIESKSCKVAGTGLKGGSTSFPLENISLHQIEDLVQMQQINRERLFGLVFIHLWGEDEQSGEYISFGGNLMRIEALLQYCHDKDRKSLPIRDNGFAQLAAFVEYCPLKKEGKKLYFDMHTAIQNIEEGTK
jgi:penicillin-binding protein-related factor A (putative recombinase)